MLHGVGYSVAASAWVLLLLLVMPLSGVIVLQTPQAMMKTTPALALTFVAKSFLALGLLGGDLFAAAVLVLPPLCSVRSCRLNPAIAASATRLFVSLSAVTVQGAVVCLCCCPCPQLMCLQLLGSMLHSLLHGHCTGIGSDQMANDRELQ